MKSIDRLSDFVSVAEFTHSQTASRLGIDNSLPINFRNNAENLCKLLLDRIREKYGRPILISSGFRNEKLNKLIGGAENSQHTTGQAADFNLSGYEPKSLFEKLLEDENIRYDQLILEFDKWIHISWSNKPRRQAFIAYKNGNKTIYERVK